MQQDYRIEEILIVDDEATQDDTKQIVAQFQEPGLFPIRWISAGFRTGLAHARNVAVKESKTELIASLDADCVPEPEWLSFLVENMKDENVVGVCGKLLEARIKSPADKWRSVHMRQHWGDDPILNPKFLYGHSNIFRTDQINKMGRGLNLD